MQVPSRPCDHRSKCNCRDRDPLRRNTQPPAAQPCPCGRALPARADPRILASRNDTSTQVSVTACSSLNLKPAGGFLSPPPGCQAEPSIQRRGRRFRRRGSGPRQTAAGLSRRPPRARWLSIWSSGPRCSRVQFQTIIAKISSIHLDKSATLTACSGDTHSACLPDPDCCSLAAVSDLEEGNAERVTGWRLETEGSGVGPGVLVRLSLEFKGECWIFSFLIFCRV